MKMEAVNSSETLIPMCQTIWHHFPEDNQRRSSYKKNTAKLEALTSVAMNEDSYLLECDVMRSGRFSPTFRSKLLSASSGWKSTLIVVSQKTVILK
jgi:hypothetical protein